MFMSTSTSPAAERSTSIENAFIVAQTANSWQIQPMNWNPIAVTAASGDA